MAVTKIKVVYLDGRVERVIVTPRAQVMTEQRFAGINEQNRIQASYYMGWLSLFRAGKEPDDFEVWLDKIEDAEDVTEEKSEPDPTVSAPPADTSSN